MAYRIVKINSRCKLETSLNYLVCRTEVEQRILLDEISVLIIENQQACLTSALISECMAHNIRLIFCDPKHNPQGELEPYHGCYDGLAKYRLQASWTKENSDMVWAKIIENKISNQSFLLRRKKDFDKAGLLKSYALEINPGDPTNREGLAAKVYFNALFGMGFDRRNDFDPKNVFLNYGYSVLLGLVNREIASFGYLNQVGIHHIGETNPFNLGCDFVEPFRPFVDEVVAFGDITPDDYKKKMLEAMGKEIGYAGKKMLLQNAVHMYVQAVLSLLNQKEGATFPAVYFLDGDL